MVVLTYITTKIADALLPVPYCCCVVWNGCELKSVFLGQDIQPKRDLTRFVKWPRYIRLQRQRSILYKRLKVPPAINQFTQALDRQTGKGVPPQNSLDLGLQGVVCKERNQNMT